MPDAPWSSWTPGTRVVVRRRLSDDEAVAAGKALTDVIGVVVRTTATELVLREDAGGSAPPHRGHGEHDAAPALVVVPLDVIVAGKPVPPRPPRRPS